MPSLPILSLQERMRELEAKIGITFHKLEYLLFALIDATWEGKDWSEFRETYFSGGVAAPVGRKGILAAIGRISTQSLELLSAIPQKGNVVINSSLALVGDAFLKAALMQEHYSPDIPAKELAHTTQPFLTNRHLCSVAQSLGIKPFVLICPEPLLGTRWKLSFRRESPHKFLADVMEAIIGAIFLDQGEDAVRQFVIRVIMAHNPET